MVLNDTAYGAMPETSAADAAILESQKELAGMGGGAAATGSGRLFEGLGGKVYKIKNFDRRGAHDYNTRRELRPVFRGPDTSTHKKATDGGKKDIKKEAAIKKREDGDWSATEVSAVSSWRGRGEPGGMAQLAMECGRSLDTVRKNINKGVPAPREPRLNATGGANSLLGTFDAT